MVACSKPTSSPSPASSSPVPSQQSTQPSSSQASSSQASSSTNNIANGTGNGYNFYGYRFTTPANVVIAGAVDGAKTFVIETAGNWTPSNKFNFASYINLKPGENVLKISYYQGGPVRG